VDINMSHRVPTQRRRAFLLAAGSTLLVAPMAWRNLVTQDTPRAGDDGTDPVISAEHLSCIRSLRFIWIPNVESGGPAVDVEAPFGSPDAYGDLAKIAPGRNRSELKQLYADVMNRIPAFTKTAKLEPGSYILSQPIVLRLREFMTGGNAGIRADGSFDFTDEHRKLIGALRWWYIESNGFSFTFDHNDLPDTGPWRVATVNFKRPFGDMTYFEIDMAQTLGIDLKPNSKDPEEDRLFGLYQQMHVALQVFVMNAAV
jgi:hypothetical protein